MSAAKPSLSARMHFAWGQSCAYWGNKTLSKSLYRWAVNATRAAAEAPDWPAPVMRRAVIRGRELDDYAGAVRDPELIESDPDRPRPTCSAGSCTASMGCTPPGGRSTTSIGFCSWPRPAIPGARTPTT